MAHYQLSLLRVLSKVPIGIAYQVISGLVLSSENQSYLHYSFQVSDYPLCHFQVSVSKICIVPTELPYNKCYVWPCSICQINEFSYELLISVKVGLIIVIWLKYFNGWSSFYENNVGIALGKFFLND